MSQNQNEELYSKQITRLKAIKDAIRQATSVGEVSRLIGEFTAESAGIPKELLGDLTNEIMDLGSKKASSFSSAEVIGSSLVDSADKKDFSHEEAALKSLSTAAKAMGDYYDTEEFQAKEKLSRELIEKHGRGEVLTESEAGDYAEQYLYSKTRELELDTLVFHAVSEVLTTVKKQEELAQKESRLPSYSDEFLKQKDNLADIFTQYANTHLQKVTVLDALIQQKDERIHDAFKKYSGLELDLEFDKERKAHIERMEIWKSIDQPIIRQEYHKDTAKKLPLSDLLGANTRSLGHESEARTQESNQGLVKQKINLDIDQITKTSKVQTMTQLLTPVSTPNSSIKDTPKAQGLKNNYR